MVTTEQTTLSHATSRDGTTIGYFTSGEGPPLLLVHGGLGDHTRWGPLLPHLEPHVTVHAMDRRGRGASGDHPDYAVEREHEDVAAVVDHIAQASGSAVDVYGISFGGFCALGGATLTHNVGRLALYEGWPPVPAEMTAPAGFVERAEALLAEGHAEAALELAYRKLLGLSDEEFQTVRAQRSWPARVAAAHTVPRELRAVPESAFAPEQAARVTVPTLLLVGSESPDWHAETMAATLPDARIAVLEGQAHVADLLAPELVATHLLRFLHAPRPR
jgi:pimeloyl-ACP methyl ester carboxylesterase